MTDIQKMIIIKHMIVLNEFAQQNYEYFLQDALNKNDDVLISLYKNLIRDVKSERMFLIHIEQTGRP